MLSGIQQYFDRRKVRRRLGSFDAQGLCKAVALGEKDLLEILLKANIRPDCTSPEGLSPVMIAIENNQVQLLPMLLSANPDLGQLDSQGNTALMYAIVKEEKYAFEQILEFNFPHDFSHKNHSADTALHLAAATSSAFFTRELLDHGADPECLNRDGETPLMIACRLQKTAVVKALLESGADVHRRNKEGKSLADIAGDHFRIRELLEIHGGRKQSLFPAPSEKLLAWLNGFLETFINRLDEEETIREAENKGRLFMEKMLSDEQFLKWMEQVEEHPLQQDLTWLLNMMIEIRDVMQKQQMLLKDDQWKEEPSTRNWQKQISWSLRQYQQYLDQQLSNKTFSKS